MGGFSACRRLWLMFFLEGLRSHLLIFIFTPLLLNCLLYFHNKRIYFIAPIYVWTIFLIIYIRNDCIAFH